ncbi:MAG: hypothetical protein IJC01_00740, partial [Clostridia bacterium]|nr:hypothetical protein [Clostridia bacterium]
HDDWGSQRAPFFSLDTCMEMIVPHIKKIVDFCHSKGLWFQQHSCGKNEMLVPAYIAAGVDLWCPQPMNDIVKLVKEYGDKLLFGWSPVAIPEEAPCKLFIATMGETAYNKAFLIVSKLRENGIVCDLDHMERGVKAQFKYSDKIKAEYVATIGENELSTGTVTLKKMSDGTTESVAIDDLVDKFSK